MQNLYRMRNRRDKKKSAQGKMENSEPIAKRRKTRGTETASSSSDISDNNVAGSSDAQERASSSDISENNVAGPSDQEERAYRIGRIARVKLINFMCHANFIVEFNKNINIFVGCNGSGKSAIITAVVICLGGNAAAAERSKNMAQLIRRGQSSASIEITLYNDGIDAYEYDKYGNRITVHRQINSNGSTQYRVASEKGQIITRSLSDLRKMLTYMNVQVDNPICMLNQNAARSFLKEVDLRKRYTLFLKATQIEQIIQIFNDAAASYRLSKSHLSVWRKKLAQQVLDYNAAKDHYERLLSVETLKCNLKNLIIELEWNKVGEEETKYKAIVNKLIEINEQIGQLEGSITTWSNDTRGLDEEKENFVAQLRVIKETITTNRLTHDSLRILRTERRNQLEQHETRYKDMLAKLKRLKNEIGEIQISIDDRQTSNKIILLKRENEEKLRLLMAECDASRNTETKIKEDLQILDSQAEQTESILGDLQHNLRNILTRIEKTKNKIKQIDVTRSDNLSIFGKHMPKLIATIEDHYQAGKFSELPRGPIGRYVQVKNKNWSQLIEHILGPQLQCFIFNNHEDSKYFDTVIMNQFSKIKKPIHSKIVTKFCYIPYDVRRNKVKVSNESATVLLDEIIVSDPVVLNVLIDQIHIETILMCSDSQAACNYTMIKTNVPKHLSRIFSLQPTAEYHPAPNFRSYGINVKHTEILQTDLKKYKVQLELELSNATIESEAVQSELNTHNQIMMQSKTSLSQQKDSLLKHDEKLRQIENAIEQIEEFEYPAQHEVDVLLNELKELQNAYDATNSDIDNEKEKCQQIKQEVKAIGEEFKLNQLQLKKLEKDVNEKMKQIDEITEKIDNFAINNLKIDLQRCETEKGKLEDDKNQQEIILTSVTQNAADKGGRINKMRSSDKIQSLIKTTEHKIQTRCTSTDDISTVKIIMIERENGYKRTELRIATMEDILKDLDMTRKARYKWLSEEFRHLVSQLVTLKFNLTLKSRKFGGEMYINNEHKTLEINVVPQDKHIPDAVSNTKSLSGGERSFSTLALLTSLWSCISSPFYFMDEYDVFTDQINRRFMAQLLISEAKRRPDKQFCFFTPQDMSFVEESDSVTFHRLENHLKSQ